MDSQTLLLKARIWVLEQVAIREACFHNREELAIAVGQKFLQLLDEERALIRESDAQVNMAK